MKNFLPLLVWLVPSFLIAQTADYCDSVFIKCCEFKISPNTLTIQAANHSNYLFDYPAFALINEASDTLAKETVNYYGIGYNFQEHTLELNQSLELPFSGKLLLYTWFYDTLWCEFPLYIPDSVTSVNEFQKKTTILVYPNPTEYQFKISYENTEDVAGAILEIIDSQGKVIDSKAVNGHATCIERVSTKGLYLIRLINRNGKTIASEKIIVR